MVLPVPYSNWISMSPGSYSVTRSVVLRLSNFITNMVGWSPTVRQGRLPISGSKVRLNRRHEITNYLFTYIFFKMTFLFFSFLFCLVLGIQHTLLCFTRAWKWYFSGLYVPESPLPAGHADSGSRGPKIPLPSSVHSLNKQAGIAKSCTTPRKTLGLFLMKIFKLQRTHSPETLNYLYHSLQWKEHWFYITKGKEKNSVFSDFMAL